MVFDEIILERPVYYLAADNVPAGAARTRTRIAILKANKDISFMRLWAMCACIPPGYGAGPAKQVAA